MENIANTDVIIAIGLLALAAMMDWYPSRPGNTTLLSPIKSAREVTGCWPTVSQKTLSALSVLKIRMLSPNLGNPWSAAMGR